MSTLVKLLTQPKNRRVAVALALLGTVIPLPIAGIHKFYLGQPLWGVIYLLLNGTPIPRIAAAIDAVWYIVQDQDQFQQQFNGLPSTVLVEPQYFTSLAEALRQLEQLRQEGLLSEYEFEQKRRQLLADK